MIIIYSESPGANESHRLSCLSSLSPLTDPKCTAPSWQGETVTDRLGRARSLGSWPEGSSGCLWVEGRINLREEKGSKWVDFVHFWRNKQRWVERSTSCRRFPVPSRNSSFLRLLRLCSKVSHSSWDPEGLEFGRDGSWTHLHSLSRGICKSSHRGSWGKQ